eukprot:UN08886
MVEITGALNLLVKKGEKDPVIDTKLLKTMIDLHKASCPKDQIVGLYCTWHAPDHLFAAVHEAICKQTSRVEFNAQSLFLMVGPGIIENRVRITGFTSKTMFGICRYIGATCNLEWSEGENFRSMDFSEQPN